MENETLTEADKYPIVYEDMPFFTCELTGLSILSFSVADDPFFKSQRAKYYPEVVMINGKSDVKLTINGLSKFKSDKYQNTFEYCEDFREPSLKVNDDRKVKFNLAELVKKGRPGKTILLFVKCFDLK
jgi:hypothetical protein